MLESAVAGFVTRSDRLIDLKPLKFDADSFDSESSRTVSYSALNVPSWRPKALPNTVIIEQVGALGRPIPVLPQTLKTNLHKLSFAQVSRYHECDRPRSAQDGLAPARSDEDGNALAVAVDAHERFFALCALHSSGSSIGTGAHGVRVTRPSLRMC